MSFFSASFEDLWMASVGGAMLGISTSAYLALIGRVTGMSGSLRQTYLQITAQKTPDPIHIVYVGGLMLGSSAMGYILPNAFEAGGFNPVLMAVSGLLVGVGTTVGHGCTSGHGLCGLARFSTRSLYAVTTFFGTAIIISSSLSSSLVELKTPSPELGGASNMGIATLALGSSLVAYGAYQLQDNIASLSAIFCASLFSAGLVISGMVRATKVHAFLDFTGIPTGVWDPSLALVFFSGLGINLILFPILRKSYAPVVASKWDLPTSTNFSWDLIYGGALFGVGWALGGICPGPGMVGISGQYGLANVIWIVGCLIGQQAATSFQSLRIKK
ncbi:hypothetical protein AAMO2058_000288800 [Amorphochlora amoebiformis]